MDNRSPTGSYNLGFFARFYCLFIFVICVCLDALNEFDGGVRQILGPKGTAGIWATYPQSYLSIWNGLGDQVNNY